MQLLGSAKNKITKDESNEKVVLVHGNRPKTYIFLKTFDLEFSQIEVWFTDENSKPLEIEDKTNITLVIN